MPHDFKRKVAVSNRKLVEPVETPEFAGTRGATPIDVAASDWAVRKILSEDASTEQPAAAMGNGVLELLESAIVDAVRRATTPDSLLLHLISGFERIFRISTDDLIRYSTTDRRVQLRIEQIQRVFADRKRFYEHHPEHAQRSAELVGAGAWSHDNPWSVVAAALGGAMAAIAFDPEIGLFPELQSKIFNELSVKVRLAVGGSLRSPQIDHAGAALDFEVSKSAIVRAHGGAARTAARGVEPEYGGTVQFKTLDEVRSFSISLDHSYDEPFGVPVNRVRSALELATGHLGILLSQETADRPAAASDETKAGIGLSWQPDPFMKITTSIDWPLSGRSGTVSKVDVMLDDRLHLSLKHDGGNRSFVLRFFAILP